MGPWLLLAIYCAAIVAASLAGGILPGRMRLSHVRLQLSMSFVAGLMLGVAVLHLLPHSISEFAGSVAHGMEANDAHQADAGGFSSGVDHSVAWMLGGLLAMFFMIRLFHTHQHAHGAAEEDEHEHHHHSHDHDHDHDHGHHHHPEQPSARGAARVAWVGLALGLSLHTLIDGVALAAAVEAERHHSPFAGLAGLSAFLAIVLHKPLDSLAIATVMKAGGWSSRASLVVNAGYALMCPIGAVLFSTLSGVGVENRAVVLGAALAFSAGVFLCIALSDILPEVAFHSHDRAILSATLLAGVTVAWLVGLLESQHMHSHAPHKAAEHSPE